MFSPEKKEELKDAINLWCINEKLALETYGHISEWNTSKITDMSKLFQEKYNFDGDLSNWDVSNVTNINSMFDKNCHGNN